MEDNNILDEFVSDLSLQSFMINQYNDTFNWCASKEIKIRHFLK